MGISIGKYANIDATVQYVQNQLTVNDSNTEITERPGTLHGRLANTFSLEGKPLTEDVLRSLLEGRDPNTGELMWPGASHRKNVAFDLTTNAEKTASIAWSLLPSQHRDEIAEIHKAATEKAMHHFEANIASVRSGPGGINRSGAAGIIWARFDHTTSRALDPQLHSHNVLFNLAVRPNGTVASLDGATIFRARRELDAIYTAEFARGLERAGYALSLAGSEGHQFRIVGIDDAFRKLNSQRRSEIERAAERFNYRTPSATQAAALNTRQAKQAIPEKELFQLWKERGQKHGYTPERVSSFRTLGTSLPKNERYAVSKQLSDFANRYGKIHRFDGLVKNPLRSNGGRTALRLGKRQQLLNQGAHLLEKTAARLPNMIMPAPLKLISQALAKKSQQQQRQQKPTTSRARTHTPAPVLERVRDIEDN